MIFFFVLSGFLITSLLLRDLKKISMHSDNRKARLIKRFYIRRFLRLTPIYYATLLLAALINFPEIRGTLIWHITYMSNIDFALNDTVRGHIAHLWSLSVEEQFYFLWPFPMLFLTTNNAVKLIIFLIPIVWLYRCLFPIFVSSEIAMWVLLPYSMDALLIGALVAILFSNHNLRATNSKFLLLTVISAFYWLVEKGGAIPNFLQSLGIGLTSISVVFAWIIVFACDTENDYFDIILMNPMLLHIGKISYAIYLFHLFIWGGVIKILQWFGFYQLGIAVALATSMTVLLATLSWTYFEQPIIKWRDRKYPRI